MTREEAIERLKQNKAAAEFYAGMVQNTNAIENELKDIEAIDMAIEALSAEAEPTVIRCKTLLNAEDFEAVATRIRKENRNVIVIPCETEVASAEAVSREEYEETDGVITIEKQSAKDVGEIKHIVICSPNYTRYFYNESMPTSAEAVEVKAEQLPPKVPTEWINDGMVLVPQHDWIEMQKELEGYASAEAVQGWIPCSERLPEVGEILLLTVHEYGWNCKDYTRVIIGEYSDNYADHILAWMPLPEPYEPKTERRG